MRRSNFRRQLLLVEVLVALITGYNCQSYVYLEALGVNCPERDRCEGYRNHLRYEERSCECDHKCTAYKDCCIDALPGTAEQASRPPPRTDVECLHYGKNKHTGVYAISRCSNSWSGPRQIREKCQGPANFRDPLAAAPVTDVSRNETYRNLACAECNYANLTSLKTFQLKLCDGLSHLPQEEVMLYLTYNESLELWGVIRLNRFRNGTEFVGCNIIFDVPGFLNNSVRFCRANLISTCASNWNQPAIARLCASYTAAIYTNTAGYRNPHCALCNYKTLDELSCRTEVFGRKKEPISETPPESSSETPPEPSSETSPEPSSETPSEPSSETPPEPSSETPPEPSSETPPEPSSECPEGYEDDTPYHTCKGPYAFCLLLRNRKCRKEGSVPIPECPAGYKYDSFLKRCRELVCALPGHVVENGKCVRRNR